MMFINQCPNLYTGSYTSEKYKQKSTGKPWGDWLVAIILFDDEKFDHKTSTLDTTFHKPEGEEKLHDQFLYVPHTICNFSQRQVSVPMSSDTVKAKYIGLHWKQEVLGD